MPCNAAGSRADRLFVPSDGRNEVTSRPEFVTEEIAQFAYDILRNPNRALSFQIPDHLRNRIFRRDRDQYVHVIRHQMPLFNSAFLAPRQLVEYSAQRRICPNSNFLRYVGVNTTWYLHSHVVWFR